MAVLHRLYYIILADLFPNEDTLIYYKQENLVIKVRISHCSGILHFVMFLFDLIIYVPSTIFQLNRDGSSWDEPVLS